MKRTVYSILVVLAAAALPSAVHAQEVYESPDGTVVTGNNGAVDLPPKESTGAQDQIEQLLIHGTGDGKHIIVVLDSVRADEKAITEFTSAIRNRHARIRQDGVRVIAGDDKEAKKYGAGASDEVIIVATERVGNGHE